MTLDQLLEIMPAAGPRAQLYLDPLNAAMAEYAIDTPLRQAGFLSQIAHESGSLRYVRELASGKAYEDRADLGNSEPGDGPRFKGRGFLQITGRTNYRRCSLALYGDERLLSDPALLETPAPAARSAAWYWSAHGLSALADAGDVRGMTRRINGGLNGLAERMEFYARAKKSLMGA
jgi:putative chitinase